VDDDPLVPPAPRPERARHQALVVPELVLVQTVDVGGVDEGDARIQRGVNDPDGLRFGRPVLQGQVHPAESDGGDGGRPGPEGPLKQGRAVS